MRLYVDEDVARVVAVSLTQTHDVFYVESSAARSRTDAWHLRQASIESRVLITLNHKDFRFLHRVWTSMRLFAPIHTRHGGILTATRAPKSQEPWLAALESMLTGDEDLAGRLLVWHPASNEWREDDWRPDD